MASAGDKDAYTRKMEERLEGLRQEFQQLELEQMKKGEVEARAKLAAAKKSVRKKRKQTEGRLDSVRRAGAGGWEDARTQLDESLTELQGEVERARRDFEGTLEEDEEADEEAHAGAGS